MNGGKTPAGLRYRQRIPMSGEYCPVCFKLFERDPVLFLPIAHAECDRWLKQYAESATKEYDENE